jgi:iron complex outermembrane receptor protein
VQGVYLNLTYQWTDKIFLTFDNSRTAEGYGLLNSRLGIRRTLAKRFNIDLYGGADNITGQLYPTELFLNVNDRRYYISGPNKATFYGGLSLQYMFNQ